MTSLRFIATSLFAAWILKKKKTQTLFLKKNRKMHLLSVLFVLRCGVITTGFRLSALAKPLAVILTWPIMFVILSAIFLKTPLNGVSWASLAFAAGGMFLILADPSLLAPGENYLGYLLMLIGAVITAVEMLLNRTTVESQGGVAVLFYSTFLGAIILLPELAQTLLTERDLQNNLIALVVTCSWIIGTIAYYCALEASSPVSTAVLSYLEVPIATAAAVVFFNEEFSPRAIFGILCILIGALTVSIYQARSEKRLHLGKEAIQSI
jgi:drug/metabolite transporter (DMT)-like permease